VISDIGKVFKTCNRAPERGIERLRGCFGHASRLIGWHDILRENPEPGANIQPSR
jgi:hypothetical protein